LQTLREVQPSLTSRSYEIMQYHIDQMVENVVAEEESYLPILATSAAVAPLLGLFGTVWGLIHAFIRISEKQAADITVIAPGIAEALITTLAGLIVAIPALVLYNYLVIRVRQLEGQIIHLADRLMFIVQQLG
jgi:biopolymer transport protein TolQ